MALPAFATWVGSYRRSTGGVARSTGVRLEPRIFRAGPIVNGRQFNEFQIAVSDAAEARGAVRALHRAGVDFIKVHAAISREAYFGVREECKRVSLRFAGHIPRAITPEEASDAGQVSFEHVGAIADRMAKAAVPADEVAGALERFRREDAAEERKLVHSDFDHHA